MFLYYESLAPYFRSLQMGYFSKIQNTASSHSLHLSFLNLQSTIMHHDFSSFMIVYTAMHHLFVNLESYYFILNLCMKTIFQVKTLKIFTSIAQNWLLCFARYNKLQNDAKSQRSVDAKQSKQWRVKRFCIDLYYCVCRGKGNFFFLLHPSHLFLSPRKSILYKLIKSFETFDILLFFTRTKMIICLQSNVSLFLHHSLYIKQNKRFLHFSDSHLNKTNRLLNTLKPNCGENKLIL